MGQYVEIESMFTKQSDELFCFKHVSGTSFEEQNRMIFVALTKTRRSVAYAYCQYPAGKVATCFNTFSAATLGKK